MVRMFKCGYHPRLEDSVGSLGTGVPSRNEPQDMAAGNGTQALSKSSVHSNY